MVGNSGVSCIIWKYNLMILAAEGFNFDESESGLLHEKHPVKDKGKVVPVLN
jgi:hypothetical protein